MRTTFSLALALLLSPGLSACAYFFPSCQTIPPCPAGQLLCTQDSCSDLSSDRLNCGACNHVCAPGLVCRGAPDAGASCGCPTTGAALVNGECIDLQNDAQNCGAVGTVCASGVVCLRGACGCPGLGDGGSIALCAFDGGQACVDLSVDDLSCGGCGVVCDSLAACQSSRCVCQDGTPQCGAACCGAAGPCVDGGCAGAGSVDGGLQDAGTDGGALGGDG